MSKTSYEKGKLGGGHETSVLLVKDREHLLVCDELVLVDVLKKSVAFHLEFNYQRENENIIYLSIIQSQYKINLHIIICQYLMTQLKRLWIMSEDEFTMFCNFRQSCYKSICTSNELEYFPDDKLMKYYVWNMVCFLRARKYPADRPFKFEKVIFTAVALFKRYYLVNSFVDEEPMQNCICAMYLALKLNEYSEAYIQKMALAWRGKQALQPKRNHYHYGDDGYADKQFKLLSGIGFQTGRSKMIHTIESLYGKIQQSDAKNVAEMLYEIRINLLRVYTSPSLMFLEDGPKIGLGVVLVATQKVNCIVDYNKVFGDKFVQMLDDKKDQISTIRQKIQKLQNYNQHSIKQERTQYYRKLTKVHYKKPEYKKSPRFHARHDSMILDQ